MNSNSWHFFCPTKMPIMLILLGIVGSTPASVGADLPSCIRAKCSHCRVPFIAEMCPGACAVCGPIGNKLYITTAQQSAQMPDARAFGQAQVKVPFAQQLPLPGSAGGATQQRVGEAVTATQPQRQVNSRAVNTNNNNNNNNGGRKPFRNQYGTDFGAGEQTHRHQQQQQLQQPLPFQNVQQSSGQFVPAGQFGPLSYQNQQHQQGGQFVGQTTDLQFGGGQFVPDQGGQFVQPNQQAGGQFVPADQRQNGQFGLPLQQQQQQTTSYGGFYNQQQQPDEFYPQAGFGPVPPPPPPLSPPIQSADAGGVGGGGTFANPFQPFLQQSFSSAQQFQPQQAQNGGAFTFAPPIANGGGGDGGGGGLTPVPLSAAAQFGTQIQPQQPQQYFGQYNLQPQQQQQQTNNNFNNGQFNGNGNGHNNQQQQQEAFAPPTSVLHAVPNLADPLQRPRQIYPGVPQGPTDKNLQNLVEPSSNNNFLLDKGVIGDDVKKPFSPNGFIQGENGLTCPKQPNWEPCVPKEIANQRFRNCCARLGDGCQQLCSYDQNLSTIQLAVLTGRCPVSRVGEMMICASGNEDATACCQAFGVFESGFDHCRPYCNPSGGLPNDGMLAEKYRCLQKLQQIQKCFYLTQRP